MMLSWRKSRGSADPLLIRLTYVSLVRAATVKPPSQVAVVAEHLEDGGIPIPFGPLVHADNASWPDGLAMGIPSSFKMVERQKLQNRLTAAPTDRISLTIVSKSFKPALDAVPFSSRQTIEIRFLVVPAVVAPVSFTIPLFVCCSPLSLLRVKGFSVSISALLFCLTLSG
jgi:hypothetical protein